MSDNTIDDQTLDKLIGEYISNFNRVNSKFATNPWKTSTDMLQTPDKGGFSPISARLQSYMTELRSDDRGGRTPIDEAKIKTYLKTKLGEYNLVQTIITLEKIKVDKNGEIQDPSVLTDIDRAFSSLDSEKIKQLKYPEMFTKSSNEKSDVSGIGAAAWNFLLGEIFKIDRTTKKENLDDPDLEKSISKLETVSPKYKQSLENIYIAFIDYNKNSWKNELNQYIEAYIKKNSIILPTSFNLVTEYKIKDIFKISENKQDINNNNSEKLIQALCDHLSSSVERNNKGTNKSVLDTIDNSLGNLIQATGYKR